MRVKVPWARSHIMFDFKKPWIFTDSAQDRLTCLQISNASCRCSRGIKIIPDIPSPHEIPDRLVDAADILILPGGAPGAKTFCQSEEVLRLIREFRNEGKWVAAICAGTTALVESVKSPRAEGEAAKKCKVTSHPSVKQEIVDAGWSYADDNERIVVDGKIITSRGPGTALLFSLTIVENLAGKAKRDEIQGPMMCAEAL